MILWTVQEYSVYERILNDGVYTCNPKLSKCLEEKEFKNAYKWMRDEMEERIGNPKKIKSPVWAWYQVEGQHKRPDMRKSEFKVSEKSVLLEIEIPDNEVLLTDHENWHMVIYDSINYKANYMEGITEEEWEKEAEKEDLFFEQLSSKEKEEYKKKSWERIIYTKEEKLPDYIQATFWELRKENIKEVWVLKE